MIQTIRTKNGDMVEITSADVFSGPEDQFGRLHGNESIAWIRIPGKTNWYRSVHKSEHRTRMAVAACETALDVIRTLERTRT